MRDTLIAPVHVFTSNQGCSACGWAYRVERLPAVLAVATLVCLVLPNLNCRLLLLLLAAARCRSWMHKFVGYCIVLFAFINIFLGLNAASLPVGASIVYAIIALLMFAFYMWQLVLSADTPLATEGEQAPNSSEKPRAALVLNRLRAGVSRR